MDSVNDRLRKGDMFSCSATFGDILIIGEQLRIFMHKSNLVRDQRHLFRWYTSCFVGSETVSWIVKTQQAPERSIAQALLNILLDHNIIHQLTGSSGFKDDSQLYRFRKDDGTYDFAEDTTTFLRAHRLCKRIYLDPQGKRLIKTHNANQQTHHHSLVGCELVDFLVQKQEAPSREDAVREIRCMLESGITRHVTDSQHFQDDKSLYQLRTDFGRDRILLDLILPPPELEFGGAIIEDFSSEGSVSSSNTDNNNINSCKITVQTEDNSDQSCDEASSAATDIPEALASIAIGERTESGYHSDHVEASPSSLSESPMFQLEVKEVTEKPQPFSGGILIRKATIEELEDPDSPYIRKFIRIASDPVGYGFVIRGAGPAYVKTVDPMGPAAAAGLKVGHFIFSVNDQKVLDVHHRELAHIVLDCNGYVTLVVMEHVRDSR